MGRPRPWLAAVLAFFYPGLGHLYLREWARAILWFALTVGTAALVLPLDPMSEASATDPGSVATAWDQIASDASTLALALVLVIVAFSIADAYAIARDLALSRRRAVARRSGAEMDGDDPVAEPATCPTCGRDLDADLDFCHWCTTRIKREEEDEDGVML